MANIVVNYVMLRQLTADKLLKRAEESSAAAAMAMAFVKATSGGRQKGRRRSCFTRGRAGGR